MFTNQSSIRSITSPSVSENGPIMELIVLHDQRAGNKLTTCNLSYKSTKKKLSKSLGLQPLVRPTILLAQWSEIRSAPATSAKLQVFKVYYVDVMKNINWLN